MNGDVEHVEGLGRRWASAEIAGDVAALDALRTTCSCWSDHWGSSWTRRSGWTGTGMAIW